MNWRFLPFFFFPFAALQAQQFNLLSYSVPEGLAQSQVFALQQDSRGYLWCGTQGGGLSRFDGHNFETFNSGSGLPSDFINTLYEDAEKRLWVGTAAGYGVCAQSRYCAAFKSEMSINAICETADKGIWLGTDKGLMTCASPEAAAEALDFPAIPKPYSVQCFLNTSLGLWVGTNRGAYRVNGSGTQSLTVKNGLPSNLISDFAYLRPGQCWIACQGGGIAVFDENTRQISAVHRQVLWPTCLCIDRQGKLWVGSSDHGVYCYDPETGVWTNIGEAQGLPHHFVRDLFCDKSGQMWIATSGGGITKVLNRQFRHFTTANGLSGNRIYALHVDDAGKIWFSASQNGIQTLDSSGFRSINAAALAGVKCKAIGSDRSGRLWIGTEGQGLYLMDTAGLRRVEGLPADRIQSILRTATGEMWVATAGQGIAVFREDATRPGSFFIDNINRNDGLSDLEINTLRADGKGNIWFGTQTGMIGFFKDGKLGKLFGGGSGLPQLPVRAMAFDGAGRLWVGYRGGGLWGADAFALESGKTLKWYSLNSRLSSQNIYLLLNDRLGHLWIGTEKGVDEVVFEEGKELAVKEMHHFGKNEGFLGIETCQDAAVCDREGNLWFGTMNGLTRYVPASVHVEPSAPILHFQDISLFYKPLSETNYAAWLDPSGGLKSGLQLEWDENHLSFEFGAVDLAQPEAFRYRWKLEGPARSDWSPWSNRQSVNFAGLQAGDYRFWVQAMSEQGAESDPIEASFSIKQPFWQRPWFWLLAGTLLAAAIFFAVRRYVRQLRKNEQEKREKLQIQNHLLQLEQKALQLQMNPHFIFNALNSIQALVGTGDTDAARQELGVFSRLMRAILSNSRQTHITLKAETDTLQQYLQIEQFCRPERPFEYHIHTGKGIDNEAIELPPMLIQPFVENAVLHGITHLQDRKGMIDIHFEVQGETLSCRIRDNGVGREKSAMLRKERAPGHQSSALQITRERLEAMCAGKSYKPMEILDIYNESGEIAGTEVVLRLPLQMRW